MNQTFKKNAVAVSVGIALAVGFAGVATAASTTATPTVVTLKKGGVPRLVTGITANEVGTWANSATTVAAANPVGFRFVIPAGLDLYGSYLGVGTGATAALTAQAVKFAPTVGHTYPIRYTKGAGGNESYLFIDTSKGTATPNADGSFTATTWAAGTLLAITVVDGSGAGVDLALAAGNRLKAGAQTLSDLSDFFATGVAAANTGTVIGAGNAATQAKLLTAIGQATDNVVGNSDTAVVGTVKAESDGSLTFQLFANSLDNTASDNTIAVPDLYLAASSSAAVGSLSISVADGIGASPAANSNIGLTATSKAVATVSQYAAVLAQKTSTDTVPNVVKGLTAQNSLAIKLTFAEAIASANASGKKITIKLDNGAKFKAISAASAISTVGSANNLTNVPTVGTNSSGDLEITLSAADVARDGDITIDAAGLLDLSGVTADSAINATLSSNITTTDLGSQTIKIANAQSRAVAVSYVDKTPTGYDTLFTGRTSVTAPTDLVALTESAGGSLGANSTVSLALSSGAKFTAGTITPTIVLASDGTSACSNTSLLGSITTTNAATATGAVSGTVSTAACKVTLGTGALDLLSATAGDLTVTVSGTAGASGSVKVATLLDATTTSVSGTLPVVQAGNSISLPDVVIGETTAAAITNNATVAIAAPNTSVASFDITGAKVFAYKVADGSDVTASVFGSATGATLTAVPPASGNGNTASVYFTSGSKSTTTSGAYKYVVKGLKATLATSASGDVSVVVSGSQSVNPNLTVTATGSATDEVSSAVGAQITKASVKVASVVSSASPAYPTATVTDSTKAVIVGLPLVAAGNDQGKPGSVYVVFIYAGTVFFMDSTGAWTTYTGATPTAYSTGSLGTTSIDVLKTATDLSSLKGGQLIVGYGLGIAGLGDPFKNMIDNARYNVVYTVK